MTQQDFEYRKENAVVPQLDFFNGGYDNIIAPPVQYSKFATMNNITKIDGKKIAGGLAGTLEGAFHMATGDFGYGLGKLFSSGVKAATGVVEPNYLSTNQIICESIRDWEEFSWSKKFFLTNFVPAEGNRGQVVCQDGVFDECYCGLGHRFFENGDYFEGMFVDGKILEGLYIFANGARYLGCFDENLNFVGKGFLLYCDGAFYYGDFKDSLRDGVGAMWYTNGVYIGDWSNNMRHGEGFLRLENGKFFDGQFYNDQQVE